MAALLTDLPTDRVVHLQGIDPQSLELVGERVEAEVVAYFPASCATLSTAVADLLAELTALAVRLYPTWLPEAADVRSPALVQALAVRRAATEGHFGPFLADLAVRAVTGGAAGDARLTAEVRAAGLARLLAASRGRQRLVLLVHPPPGESGDSVEMSVDALVAAATWFVRYGNAGCWLVGDVWRGTDAVARATVALPAGIPALPPGPVEPPAATLPVIRGRPRADSVAERALETALARQPWAYGRAWSQTYQPDPLTPAILVDLIWPAERCVVEIDGAEHRGRQQFDADRRRDVRLQLDGYAVLRFTNDQVRYELHLVLDQLERFLNQRRTAIREEAINGGRQAVT